MADHTTQEFWQCELQSSDIKQTGITFVDLDEGLGDLNMDAAVISGRTTLLVEGASIADGVMTIPPGSKRQYGKIDKRGPAEAKKRQKEKSKSSKSGIGVRKLTPVEPDTRTVLAVRVTAPDSRMAASADTLRGDIFGIGRSDTSVNLKERFKSCSYGQTLVNPFVGQTNSGYVVDNGVVDLSISKSVSRQSFTTVMNTAIDALSKLLGIADLASAFDHVMFCLPPGTTSGWIGYGRSYMMQLWC